MDKEKICVIGLGYIGLPTALLFAKEGYHVVGVDIKKETVSYLNKNKLPFKEKGLRKLYREARNNFKAKLVPEKETKPKRVCKIGLVMASAGGSRST